MTTNPADLQRTRSPPGNTTKTSQTRNVRKPFGRKYSNVAIILVYLRDNSYRLCTTTDRYRYLSYLRFHNVILPTHPPLITTGIIKFRKYFTENFNHPLTTPEFVNSQSRPACKMRFLICLPSPE